MLYRVESVELRCLVRASVKERESRTRLSGLTAMQARDVLTCGGGAVSE